MRGVIKRIATFAGALMLASFPSLAFAATADELPGLRTSYDENNVDVAGAYARFSGPSISIGQPGAGGLSFQRNYIEVKADYTGRWSHTYDIEAYLDTPATDNVTVVLNGALDTFDVSSVTTDSPSLVFSGAFLTLGTSTSTYTAKTGDRYTFTMAGGRGELTSIQYANGETRTFTYSSSNRRLLSVNNNFGYQVKFEYYSNVSTDPGYYEIYKATAINNTVDYCDPTATSCSGFTQSWPSLTFSNSGALGYNSTLTHTITDDLGRATVVTIEKFKITSVQNPIGPTITYSRARGGDGRPRKVTAVTKGSDTWTYSDLGSVYYTDPYTFETTERWRYSVTSPTNVTVGYESDVNQLWITRRTEPDGSYAFYNYDAGLLSSILAPTGQITAFEYDTRGNVLSTTIYPSPYDSSLPTADPITTSATYEASCTSTNFLYCNKPVTTTDAGGGVTNYYYDELTEGHGQLTRMTLPSPDGVAARPETRTTYESHQAYYKIGPSTWSSGAAVWLPKSVKTCATGAGNSCANAANEVVSETSYGPTSGANNLLPTTVSIRAGNGSSAATAVQITAYDDIGNVVSVDGPLKTTDGLASDDADKTRYRYDALRRVVALIGPDPDGSGSGNPLKHRAIRTTYRTSSTSELVEEGAMADPAAGLWDGNFVVLGKLETIYDSRDRPEKVIMRSGSNTILAMQQVSYNGASQPVCQTVRMNAVDFASSIAACTQGTGGKDQIVQNGYDSYGRLTTVTSGVGTSLSQTTQTITYYAPHPFGLLAKAGKIESVTDANGNKTTYLYDRFSRNWQTFYPSKTTTGSSSTTDYEQFTRDGSGNLTGVRLRDGTTVSYLYDKLNRQTDGMDGATYAYDNLGRLTSTTRNSLTASYTYDALGNIKSETTTGLGTVSYDYDLAGRRTKLSWPDSFYITYGYNAASDLLTIKENGGGALATFAYDDSGRRTSLTRSNGTTTSYTYDDASALSTIALNLAGTTNDQLGTFTRDAAGRITGRSGTNPAFDMASGASTTIAYTNNRLNQTTVANGVNLTYDDRGNATASGSVAYTYDTANRMLTAESGAITMTYDPVGRLRQYAGTSTTQFLYDGVDMIAEYSGSTLLRRYVHGPGEDEPLVWFEGAGHSGAGTPTRRFLVADERGSIVAVTDDTGTLMAANTYDEYGLPSSTSAAYAGRFRFTGQVWLADLGATGTGLYYYKARMYSPSLGRFLQADPIGYGDGMNMYSYVGNDPVNFSDPMGLLTKAGMWRVDRDLNRYGCETLKSFSGLSGQARDREYEYSEDNWDYLQSQCNNGFWGQDDVSNIDEVDEWVEAVQGGRVDPKNVDVCQFSFSGCVKENNVHEFFIPGGFLRKVPGSLLKMAAKVAPKVACFEAGTLVHTSRGLRRIEDIEVGELILSKDELTGATSFQPVVSLIRNGVKRLYAVEIVTDHGRTEVLNATAEHPFMTASGRWIGAKDLVPGMAIMIADGSTVMVSAIVDTGREAEVYNIEVAEFHTYFVGESGLWVHNACRGVWELTRAGASQIMQRGNNTFYKSASDGLWWVKDTAGHGGSSFLVYKEGAKGLEFYRNADKYGDFIVGKHKSAIGTFIPW